LCNGTQAQLQELKAAKLAEIMAQNAEGGEEEKDGDAQVTFA